MDEKKEEQGTDENSKEGIQSKTMSDLDRADSIAERLKRENDRREEILTREETLEASRKVGGITDAGQPPVKEAEDSNEDYARKVLSGEENERK